MAGAEARVGTALINYAAKDAGFSRATKRVNKQLTGFERTAGKAKRAAGQLTASIAGMAKGYLGVGAAIGAALGGAGVGAFIKAQGEMATKMEQFSSITGLTITQLQIFQKGMGEFAIASNTSNKALQTLTKATGEARRGLKSYQDAFTALGISMDELEGKSMQEVLNAVSRGLKRVEDPAKRTAAAMLLFGGRGVEVAAALRKVNFENAAYVKSITDTGIVTEKQSKVLHSVTAAYDTLGDTLDTQKQLLAAELAPEWAEMLGKMNDLAPFIFNVMTPAFKGLVSVITGVADAIGTIAMGISSVISRIFDMNDEIDVTKEKALQAERESILKNLESPGNPRAARAYRSRLSGIDAQLAGLTGAELSDTERNRIQREIANIQSQIDAPGRRRGIPALRQRLAKLQSRLVDVAVVGAEEVVNNAANDTGSKDTQKIEDKAKKSARDIMFAQLDAFKRATVGRAASEAAAVSAEASRIPEEFRRAIGANNFRNQQNVVGMLTAESNAVERFGRAHRVSQFNAKQIAEAEAATAKWYDKLVDVSSITDRLDSGLTDTFYNAITGAESLSDSLKGLIGNIAEMITKQIIYNQLVSPITSGIQSFFGLPPGRAAGGPVSARSPYLVGEKGPEIFVPNNAGTIVSNKDMMGGGVTINQHNEFKLFDDTGFNQRMIPIAAQIKEVSVQGALEALQRPGALSV